MPYQSVNRPRFFINVLEWAKANGYNPFDGAFNPLCYTLPVNPIAFNSAGTGTWDDLNNLVPYPDPDDYPYPCFWAILGHNSDIDFVPTVDGGRDSLINTEPGGSGYMGFSITRTQFMPTEIHISGEPDGYKIGSIVIGNTYDMPQSPNLSLTKSIDYGQTKEITTYNGSSMSNTLASTPPMWGDAGAWELYNNTNQAKLSRSGRRRWDLTFSFMDDGNMWGSNQSIGTLWQDAFYAPLFTESGYDSSDMQLNSSDVAIGFKYNLLTDYNFFSQVWFRTLGGTIPFIFQQDKDNHNADQFAICRFVDNSLKVTQSAFRVYDVSVSIEEVW